MARTASPDLFSSINVTPFIDVLLVLMIMLIITVPTATDKLPIDLPQQGQVDVPVTPHKLAIDAGGALYWDGRAISDAQLSPLLAGIAQHDTPLAIAADAQTRFERFDNVLATIRRAGVTRLGFANQFQLPD